MAKESNLALVFRNWLIILAGVGTDGTHDGRRMAHRPLEPRWPQLKDYSSRFCSSPRPSFPRCSIMPEEVSLSTEPVATELPSGLFHYCSQAGIRCLSFGSHTSHRTEFPGLRLWPSHLDTWVPTSCAEVPWSKSLLRSWLKQGRTLEPTRETPWVLAPDFTCPVLAAGDLCRVNQQTEPVVSLSATEITLVMTTAFQRGICVFALRSASVFCSWHSQA